MRNNLFNYSVAIRTLGKSGIAYETLINCLKAQTIQPQKIVVYLAEGYIPPRQVADEQIVYCSKGMAHQRAMKFDEIDTEYIKLIRLLLLGNSIIRVEIDPNIAEIKILL